MPEALYRVVDGSRFLHRVLKLLNSFVVSIKAITETLKTLAGLFFALLSLCDVQVYTLNARSNVILSFVDLIETLQDDLQIVIHLLTPFTALTAANESIPLPICLNPA